MFPFLPQRDPGADTIEKLAGLLMEKAGSVDDNPKVPAGYTYLGQFVDHDVTFDPTSQLQRDNDPHALVDFRTPRLDLDSLYGSGPIDQPFLYDWQWRPHPGVKLLVGRNPSDGEFATEDLPRNERGRALVGDARNDENLIISQLHLLFIRFHNKVVERVHRDHRHLGGTKLFEEAQRMVRWHYQWIVLHDYLPRIVASSPARPGVADARPLVEREFFTPGDRPFMPVEFSAAAFRFGHSMVRPDYKPNDGQANVPILAPSSRSGLHLGGFRRLPATLEIEWKHFFRTTGMAPQRSMRIDPSLSEALFHLPPDGAALARLNLSRGRALGLPAGPDVAHAMGVTPLSDDELLEPLQPLPRDIDDPTAEALLRAMPLWYYVLCEALWRGGGGQRLGPVGGRIVAEVLLGLLETDPSSYLRQWPRWQPELSKGPDHSFTMADLVRFAQDD